MLIPLFYYPRIRKALENKSNMEDDRVAILEAQLAQAKLIAEEADKKYEEVRWPDLRDLCSALKHKNISPSLTLLAG